MLFPNRLYSSVRPFGAGLSLSVLGALGAAVAIATPAAAQSRLPTCPPPSAEEFLLLVRGETEAERNKIASILPAENTVLVCQYQNETLVRAGGFTSLETVNAWATYMTTVEGFESFVSRAANPGTVPTANQGNPAGSAAGTAQNTANSQPSGVAYQPQQLPAGYAVLVDYGTSPEVAATVQQLVRPVGVAVYQQKAYLLAAYTSDASSAETTLQRLNNAQMNAILVDAQSVVRLSAEVARF
jgi:hypothetical protein